MDNKENDKEVLEMVEEAIDENRVKVYYQPKFSAKGIKVAGVEALCRIENEYHELVLPGEFIPVLERQESSDAIRRLDWFIITKACKFLKRLQRERLELLPVAVNLSRRHLSDEPVEHYMCSTANYMEIPHKYLEVELTESAAEDDSLELQRLIYRLRGSGFRVAIDDFGTGQANFKFLIENQVDVIKLDKSLISHGCDDPREKEVVRDLIRMAKRLGLTVVAEGVENARQWNFLIDHGCDLLQGYFAAEPLSEAEFFDFYNSIEVE